MAQEREPETEYEKYVDLMGPSVSQDGEEWLKEGRSADRGPFCAKRRCFGTSGPRVWCIRRRGDRAGVALISVAVFLIVMAALAPFAVDKAIQHAIDLKTIPINDASNEGFKTFVDSGYGLGVYLNYSIWWFNLTNPEETLRGERPLLQEMGPFVYRERRQKLDLSFSDDGELVSFRLYKYYVFDPESSPNGLTDDMLVTNVNPVTQFLMAQLKALLSRSAQALLSEAGTDGSDISPSVWEDAIGPLGRSPMWQVALKLVLCEGGDMGLSPFTTASVRDTFWGHHNDSLLLAMQKLTAPLQKLAERLHLDLPLPVVPEAFPGLQPNLTSEADMDKRVGPNVVHTGKRDRAALQQYHAFQNMTILHSCPDPTTGPVPDSGDMPACYVYRNEWTEEEAMAHGYRPQWNSTAANQVLGTDGSMFEHPLKADEVPVFQEDFRRPVIMKYRGDHRTADDVLVRRYTMRDEDWRNDSDWATDYYQSNTLLGMANLSNIAGFPMYLSKPHFLEADPSLRDAVGGLTPDPDAHLTFIDAEPITGVTFETHKRVQLSVLLSDLSFGDASEEAVTTLLKMLGRPTRGSAAKCFRSPAKWDLRGETYMPLMWYDEGFVMPRSFILDFKRQVYGAQRASGIFHIVGLVLGISMFLVGLVLIALPRWRQRQERKAAQGGGQGTSTQPLLDETKTETV